MSEKKNDERSHSVLSREAAQLHNAFLNLAERLSLSLQSHKVEGKAKLLKGKKTERKKRLMFIRQEEEIWVNNQNNFYELKVLLFL